MKILFKFASRSRPNKFFDCMENIMSLCKTDFKVLGTFDEDDQTMNTSNVIEKLNRYEKLIYYFDKSKNKVDAINRDMDKAPEWDILINTSDDMKYYMNGFDEMIIKDMQFHWPEGCGCLHYPDGVAQKELMTLSIMDKKYYNLDGYIYHPTYNSLFCDNEATQVAITRGRIRYSPTDFFRHEHPANGYGNNDDQYRKTESYWGIDLSNYNSRKSQGFPK